MNSKLIEVQGGRLFVKIPNLWYTQHVTMLRWLDAQRVGYSFESGGFYIFDNQDQFDLFADRWYSSVQVKSVPRADRQAGCEYLPD